MIVRHAGPPSNPCQRALAGMTATTKAECFEVSNGWANCHWVDDAPPPIGGTIQQCWTTEKVEMLTWAMPEDHPHFTLLDGPNGDQLKGGFDGLVGPRLRVEGGLRIPECVGEQDALPHCRLTPSPSPPPPVPPSGAGCIDTCVFASDGDCDDGGPGAEYSACALCSNCYDCGRRSSGECGASLAASPPPPPPLAGSGGSEIVDWFGQWWGAGADNVSTRVPSTVSMSYHPCSGLLYLYCPNFNPLYGQCGLDSPHQPGQSTLFTTEIHRVFKYRGGEILWFTSTDDLWIYIDDTLILDQGGILVDTWNSLSLDNMTGLTLNRGQTYTFDLFTASRHSADRQGHHPQFFMMMSVAIDGSSCPNGCHASYGQGACDVSAGVCRCSGGFHGDDCGCAPGAICAPTVSVDRGKNCACARCESRVVLGTEEPDGSGVNSTGAVAPPVATLRTSVVVAGDVSALTDGVRAELVVKVAGAAAVPPAAVTLTVEPASVRLTFTISFASVQDAADGSYQLHERLANPASATAFLVTASYTPTVESVAPVAFSTVVPGGGHPPPPPPPPPLPSRSPQPSSPATVGVDASSGVGAGAAAAACLATLIVGVAAGCAARAYNVHKACQAEDDTVSDASGVTMTRSGEIAMQSSKPELDGV